MRYLSDEWFLAATQALEQSSAPPTALVIEQHVDAIAWRIVIRPDGSTLTRSLSDAGATDAVFRQSLKTAKAVARGTTDAHQAFLLGDIRYEGDIDRLIEARDALTWLEDVFAPVMAATTFD